eukprot:4746002-Amphidinium_carterae.1
MMKLQPQLSTLMVCSAFDCDTTLVQGRSTVQLGRLKYGQQHSHCLTPHWRSLRSMPHAWKCEHLRNLQWTQADQSREPFYASGRRIRSAATHRARESRDLAIVCAGRTRNTRARHHSRRRQCDRVRLWAWLAGHGVRSTGCVRRTEREKFPQVEDVMCDATRHFRSAVGRQHMNLKESSQRLTFSLAAFVSVRQSTPVRSSYSWAPTASLGRKSHVDGATKCGPLCYARVTWQ